MWYPNWCHNRRVKNPSNIHSNWKQNTKTKRKSYNRVWEWEDVEKKKDDDDDSDSAVNFDIRFDSLFPVFLAFGIFTLYTLTHIRTLTHKIHSISAVSSRTAVFWIFFFPRKIKSQHCQFNSGILQTHTHTHDLVLSSVR